MRFRRCAGANSSASFPKSRTHFTISISDCAKNLISTPPSERGKIICSAPQVRSWAYRATEGAKRTEASKGLPAISPKSSDSSSGGKDAKTSSGRTRCVGEIESIRCKANRRGAIAPESPRTSSSREHIAILDIPQCGQE